jgi:hypothetical protein
MEWYFCQCSSEMSSPNTDWTGVTGFFFNSPMSAVITVCPFVFHFKHTYRQTWLIKYVFRLTLLCRLYSNDTICSLHFCTIAKHVSSSEMEADCNVSASNFQVNLKIQQVPHHCGTWCFLKWFFCVLLCMVVFSDKYMW